MEQWNRLPEADRHNDKHLALGEQPVQVEADAAEVDLGLFAEGVVLGHRHLPQGYGLAAAGLGHVPPHGRLAESAPCSSTSRCHTRRAVWRCLLLPRASRSASSQPSIVAFQGSSTGDNRAGPGFSQRWDRRRQRPRTVRRCGLHT